MATQTNAFSGSMSAKQGSVTSFDIDGRSSSRAQSSVSAPENLEAFLDDSTLAPIIGSEDGEADCFGSQKRKRARLRHSQVAIALVDEQLQHTCTSGGNGTGDNKNAGSMNEVASEQTQQPSRGQSSKEDRIRGVGAQFPSLEELDDLRLWSAE